MYPKVRGEMAEKNITLAMLVQNDKVDCNVGTLSLKLNGKAPLTLKEALGIKEVLNSDKTLEELFATETGATVCE